MSLLKGFCLIVVLALSFCCGVVFNDYKIKVDVVNNFEDSYPGGLGGSICSHFLEFNDSVNIQHVVASFECTPAVNAQDVSYLLTKRFNAIPQDFYESIQYSEEFNRFKSKNKDVAASIENKFSEDTIIFADQYQFNKTKPRYIVDQFCGPTTDNLLTIHFFSSTMSSEELLTVVYEMQKSIKNLILWLKIKKAGA